MEEEPLVCPDLMRADLKGAQLPGFDLRRACLIKADLSQTDLSRAYLGGADMRGAVLFGANLDQANLSQADLSASYLVESNMQGADLSGADLSGAHLRAVNLSGADLWGADLSGTDLSWVNLRQANLSGANLTGADLVNTHMGGARVGHTVFGDLDLSEVHGLESVRHWGPSTIGVDTIHRSRGAIPEIFLRRAGVPGALVGYAPDPAQSHACFISYAGQDEPFAQRLYADLQGFDVRCWLAPEGMPDERRRYEQLDREVPFHHELVLVLSEDSLGGEWVATEIRRARKAESRDQRRKLYPVRLVDMEVVEAWVCFDAGEDLAPGVREHFIPDFSNWIDRGSYQAAFDRLLRDLKAAVQI
jgi:uncharacterized protein YjbI with pentapeptide repeats